MRILVVKKSIFIITRSKLNKLKIDAHACMCCEAFQVPTFYFSLELFGILQKSMNAIWRNRTLLILNISSLFLVWFTIFGVSQV